MEDCAINKLKLLSGFIGFAAIIICAVVVYNVLIGKVSPDIELLYGPGAASTEQADRTTNNKQELQENESGGDLSETESSQPETTSSFDIVGEPETNNGSDSGSEPDTTGDFDIASEPEANNGSDNDGSETETADSADEEKQKAPDFSMRDAEGVSVNLSDFFLNGKPVILNFWASWCPPCKEEMPVFDKLFLELGDSVQFIMLDLTDGQRETQDIGAKFIKEQGYSFPVYFDIDQEGAIAYGIRYIPTTVFINVDGNIAAGAQSALNEEVLRKGIGLIN